MTSLDSSAGVFSWLFCVVSLLVVVWATVTAQWRALIGVPVRQHLWLGAGVLIAVFWSIVKLPVTAQIQLHPLLLTSATLIFGLRLALVLGALAVLLNATLVGVELRALPFNYLLVVVPAVCTSKALLLMIEKARWQNLFVYTLGGGFVGGMLSMLSVAACSLMGLWLCSRSDFDLLWPNSYVFLLLLFPEGFCNGTIVSALAILLPNLVKTYDEDFYLK